jgi:RND family efflux transporter MFP subunit
MTSLVSGLVLTACAEKPDAKKATAENENSREEKKEDKEAVDDAEKEHKPVKVVITTARSSDITREVVVPGIVSALPDRSVKVGPAISGKLTAVYVVPGQSVSKNQVIAKLDDRHIQDQIEQASVAIQTAINNVQPAENNVSFATENLERTKKLFAAEVLAKKDILLAENQLQQAKAQLVAAKAGVLTAETSRKQIETELTFTQVRSPLSGVVANRYLNVGDTADLNTPIAQIVQLSTVVINASLPADSPERLKTGQHAQIRSVAHSDISFDGVVKSISPVIDSTTNTIKVQLECQNRNMELREGQAVTVAITSSVDRNKILVPLTALVPDPEKPDAEMVYVIEQGKAHRVSVTKGGTKGQQVEILSGLINGQKIIAEGAYGLPNNSAVEPGAEK